jgi:predicted acetyltransferase
MYQTPGLVLHRVITPSRPGRVTHAAESGSYHPRMPELLEPTVRLHSAWREAHDEWGPGLHEDGFGLHLEDDVNSSAGFAAWVGRLVQQSDTTIPVAADRVHCTYRWIIEGEQVLGGIALRHELNERLMQDGGHIGYGIRPSARRRGVASWALTQMVGMAKELGIERVLLVCAVDNTASARTIERCAGVLEDIRQPEGIALQRYWIETVGGV